MKLCFLLQDTGLYYDRYLREVIEVLETDPHFREKLQTANTEDIKVSDSPPQPENLGWTFSPRCMLMLFFSVRTAASVKSWTWSVITSGLAWMS